MENISVFCGINSIGMPFTRENKYHIGYYDIIVDKLSKEGYNVDGYNISRLNKNHTWDLEDNLCMNRSMAYIKKLQLGSIDGLRNANALFKLVVPKKYKENFKRDLSDYNITLKDVYMKSTNPIFLYSGGPNDFFTFIKAGPVELIDKKVRDNIPKDIVPLLKECINNVEKNWILLKELNPNVQIYTLSYFYAPVYDYIQKIIYIQKRTNGNKNKYVNKFLEVINIYNSLLEEACNKYDYVEYCDITFLKDYCAPMDFHPNTIGNKLIADKLLKKIELHIHNYNKKCL